MRESTQLLFPIEPTEESAPKLEVAEKIQRCVARLLLQVLEAGVEDDEKEVSDDA
jgi:hypothetical protein